MSFLQGMPPDPSEPLQPHVPLFVWYSGLLFGAVALVGVVVRTALGVTEWVSGKAKTAAKTEREELAARFAAWQAQEAEAHTRILATLASLEAQLSSAIKTWQSNIGALAGLQQWQVDLGALLEQRKQQWQAAGEQIAVLEERVRKLEIDEQRRLEGR